MPMEYYCHLCRATLVGDDGIETRGGYRLCELCAEDVMDAWKEELTPKGAGPEAAVTPANAAVQGCGPEREVQEQRRAPVQGIGEEVVQRHPAPIYFDMCLECDDRDDEDCLLEPCGKIRHAASEKISMLQDLLKETRLSNDHWLAKFREADRLRLVEKKCKEQAGDALSIATKELGELTVRVKDEEYQHQVWKLRSEVLEKRVSARDDKLEVLERTYQVQTERRAHFMMECDKLEKRLEHMTKAHDLIEQSLLKQKRLQSDTEKMYNALAQGHRETKEKLADMEKRRDEMANSAVQAHHDLDRQDKINAELRAELARWKHDYTCVCGHELIDHNLETGDCGSCDCKDCRTAPSGDGKGVVRVPLTSAESGPTPRGAPAPETPEGLPNCVKYDCNCDDRTADDKCKCPRRDTADGCKYHVKAPSGVKPGGANAGEVGRTSIPPSVPSEGYPARTRPEGAPKEDPIKEVYERFKHLDKLFNDRRWIMPNESATRSALWDIWQAIREYNGVK